MATILFPGGVPAETVRLLRSLADDVERMEVFIPNLELYDAPVLEDWMTTYRPRPCLIGSVSGHPTLGDGPVVTSEVFAIDQNRRWARTFSRFYRLGTGHITSPTASG